MHILCINVMRLVHVTCSLHDIQRSRLDTQPLQYVTYAGHIITGTLYIYVNQVVGIFLFDVIKCVVMGYLHVRSHTFYF